MELEEIKKHVFISCPFDLLYEKYLNIMIENRLNPEIGLNAGVLDRYSQKQFNNISKLLKENALKCTVHAPFSDLPLGASEKSVRVAIVSRIKKSLDFSKNFNAASVVIHTGYEEFCHNWLGDKWTDNLIDSLRQITDYAKKNELDINIENVFEHNPGLHQKIFENIKEENLGFCLDIGHTRVFSKTELIIWLQELKTKLCQLHLHDNMGKKDDHLPVGKGILNFIELFGFLYAEKITPIITLETRGAQEVFISIEAVGKLLSKYPIYP
jgi:sugar phosphate isomerase/epimerase